MSYLLTFFWVFLFYYYHYSFFCVYVWSMLYGGKKILENCTDVTVPVQSFNCFQSFTIATSEGRNSFVSLAFLLSCLFFLSGKRIKVNSFKAWVMAIWMETKNFDEKRNSHVLCDLERCSPFLFHCLSKVIARKRLSKSSQVVKKYWPTTSEIFLWVIFLILFIFYFLCRAFSSNVSSNNTA